MKLTTKQAAKVMELAGKLRFVEKGIDPMNAKQIKEWRKARASDLKAADKILAIIAPPKVKPVAK